jgi:uncharacterized protein
MLYELTIPASLKSLKNLNNFLMKAEDFAKAKNFDVQVLLEDRLAPDMFNLIKQVQIACDTAKLCASRLTGIDAPVHSDNEKTIADLRERINSTISYLESMDKKKYEEAESKKISQPRWEGKYLTGTEYVLHHVLPNLYFHTSVTYSILRNNGVDVGKKDYLGELPFKMP